MSFKKSKKSKKSFNDLKNNQNLEIISKTTQNQIQGGSTAGGVIVMMMPD